MLNKQVLFIGFISLFVCAAAVSDERTTAAPCPPVIKRLVLTGKTEVVTAPSQEVQFVSALDIYVPKQEELAQALAPYNGKEMSYENVKYIKRTIQEHYRKEGRSLIVVIVPPKDVACGILQFWLLEGVIGQVAYDGNRWYPTSLVQRRIPIHEGDIFDESSILNRLTWLNESAFHQTELILTPGQKERTTDITFRTNDRFPIRIYTGTDNTGSKATDANRWYAGVNFDIPLIVDVIGTYQFTAGYSLYKFLSHFGDLYLYFPWKQAMNFFGGYSRSHIRFSRPARDGRIDSYLKEGQSWQVSGRYHIPIMPLYKSLTSRIAFGADYKCTNSNLFFTSVEQDVLVSTDFATVFQLAAHYEIEKVWDLHALSFLWENYFSPGRWLSGQTALDYDRIRPGAKVLYYFTVATLADRYKMPRDFAMAMEFRGQVASAALPPSERFGLGGLYTVRGYDEREFNADACMLGNLEISSPSFFKKKLSEEGMKLIVFLDAGCGWNYPSLPKDEKFAYLVGVGPGLKWYMKPNFKARLDYGFKLHDLSFGSTEIGRLHFSVTASY